MIIAFMNKTYVQAIMVLSAVDPYQAIVKGPQ